jgi:hypothetical protein
MKLLRSIVITVGVLILALVGISFVMPATFEVERAMVVPSEPDVVYAKFATPKTWARWSAWTTKEDPTLVYTYEGPDSGVGAVMKWTAKKMGNGRLEIVQAVPGKGVAYELRMEGSDMQVHGHVRFESAGEGTTVTWHDTGDFGKNPIWRLFGPFMDRMLGSSFERSLMNLIEEGKGV